MERRSSFPTGSRVLVLLGIALFLLFALRPVSMALSDSIAVGFDSTGHASKLFVWLANGIAPSTWWPVWYSGSPHFSAYPWLSYGPDLLILLLASSLGLHLGEITFNLLTLTEFAAEILLVAGIVLLIHKATSSSTSALLALLATLAAPIFFNDWLNGGRIAEIVGAIGFPWSLYFLEAYRHKSEFRHLLLSALAVYWAIAAHFVTGAITFGTVLAWAVLTFDRQRIFKIVESTVVPSMLLSAYWLIPFGSWLLVSSQGITSESDRSFVTLQTLLGLNGQRYDGSASVFGVVLVVTLLVILTSPKRSDTAFREALVFMGIGSVFYILFLGPILGLSYPAGLGVLIFLKWAAIFSAVFIGLAHNHISGLLTNRGKRIISMSLLVILLAWLPVTFLAVSGPPVVANTEINSKLLVPLAVQAPGIASKDFRFGSDTDTISEGYNFYFPKATQTRGYGTQFVVNPNWQFYLENTFWRSENIQESRYLADWFSMRYFATRGSIQENSFRLNPSFKEIGRYQDASGQRWAVFSYEDASPIVSATNSTRILVVGQPSAYEILFRALAFSGFDSKSGITIRGESSVKMSSNLSDFDTVVLYGYSYESTDRQIMWDSLKNYVTNGGHLVVDTGFSPDSGSALLPDPLPVDKTYATDAGKVWHFNAVDDALTEGIDFTAFSPAVYKGAPWGVSLASNSSLRPGARVITWITGKPAAVVRSFGKGTVVWTGLNLPYHADSYRNSVESTFLARLVSGRHPSEFPKFQVIRPTLDTIEVTIATPALGLLVKEFFFDDAAYHWAARVSSVTGVGQAEILRAGPDFMYVPIRSPRIYPIKVVLKFEPKILTIASEVLSVLTFSFVCVSLLIPGLAVAFERSIRNRIRAARMHISQWWLRD